MARDGGWTWDIPGSYLLHVPWEQRHVTGGMPENGDEGRDTIRVHTEEALMAEQLRRPTDQVEVYWFSEQPNGYVTDHDLEQYDSGRLGFPNTRSSSFFLLQ